MIHLQPTHSVRQVQIQPLLCGFALVASNWMQTVKEEAGQLKSAFLFV